MAFGRRSIRLMQTSFNLDSADATLLIQGAIARSNEIDVPQNIAVVDSAGHLLAFHRMDGAKFISIEIAIAKAFTASGARKATAEIGPATQPGQPGFGIQNLQAGRFTTLPGGIPVVIDGEVAGAIGVSSGTTAQDADVAEHAIRSFTAMRTAA